MLRNKLYVYGEERLEVPSHLNFGKDILDRMIEYGNHPALINADDGETMTFGQFAQKSVDIALSLARIGVKKGDVVSICSEKRMEVMPTVLGVLCAGGTFTPADFTYNPVPLLHRVKISKPKVIFMSSNTFDLHKSSFDSVGCIETYVVYGDDKNDGGVSFKDFLTETCDVADFYPTPVDGWKDFSLILFSSGTTGFSKGVPWTHLGSLMNSSSCVSERFKYSSALIFQDWHFAYGLIVTLSLLRKGTTCVFSRRKEEEDWLQAIEKYKVYYRFQNLKGVYQIYGTSEAGNACNELHAKLGPREGSVGMPSHGFIFKVVDFDTREPLGPNQRGEICFKSPTLTPGYLGVDNTDHLDSEGFYMTGDVGYYDDDRYFYVINRVKELIKFKDLSIAPAELEAMFASEPRIRQAGVAAVEGRLAALVVLQPNARVTTRELQDYVNTIITFRLGLEGSIYVVESLPRGAGDKLDRKALQAMLEQIIAKETQEPKPI